MFHKRHPAIQAIHRKRIARHVTPQHTMVIHKCSANRVESGQNRCYAVWSTDEALQRVNPHMIHGDKLQQWDCLDMGIAIVDGIGGQGVVTVVEM